MLPNSLSLVSSDKMRVHPACSLSTVSETVFPMGPGLWTKDPVWLRKSVGTEFAITAAAVAWLLCVGNETGVEPTFFRL
jgi:hypothetical protein